jgi:5-methylthioadenosine/S-adenosylhomocysteine deaminase
MQKIDLLVKNATVYTQDARRTVLKNAWVAVKDGTILEVGSFDAGKYHAPRVLDGTDRLLFPGMINTHVHIFQSLLKGLGADLGLIRWVAKAPARYGPSFNAEFQELAAKVAVMECLKSGCTLLTEFFYTQHCGELPHVIIGTMEKLGIRGIFIDTFHDCGREMGVPACYIKSADEALRHTDELVKTYHTPEHPAIRIWAGSSVTWATTLEGFRKIAEYSRATGIPYSMHTLETLEDNEVMLKKFGAKVVPVMEKTGFLSPDFLAVHCVNLTEDEIDVFKKYDVKINYNPMANAYLGSGIPLIASMRKKGLSISMGTDGAASNNTSDMMETLKMGLLLQKAGYRDSAVLSAQDMLDFVTCEGAKCVRQEEIVGSVEAGKQADFFLYDPNYLRSVPLLDPVANLMYSSSQENVETTVVSGKIVYHKGSFACGLTEAGVVAEVREKIERLVTDL